MANPVPSPAPTPDQRIRQLVTLPPLCPWCCREQGQPFPPNATTALCARHRQEVQHGR